MKDLTKRIVVIAMFYISTAIVNQSFIPFEWSYWSRVFFAIMAFLIICDTINEN